jgi:hypothetical protein
MLVSSSVGTSKAPSYSLVPPIILRKRTFYTHSTPINISVTDEFTLFNRTDSDQKYILLRSFGYRPAMKVLDQDGSELGLLPNDKVRELLEDAIRQGDQTAKPLLDSINNHTLYLQFISIPEERPFKSYQIRIIKFISILPEDRPGEGGNISIKKPKSDLRSKFNLFDIPEFRISEEFSVSDPPSRFVIVPPAGFIVKKTYSRLSAQDNNEWRVIKEDDEHYHITSKPNVVDVNIPQIPDSKRKFKLYYEIRLQKAEENIYRRFIGTLLGFSVIFALVVTRILPSSTIGIPITKTYSYIAPITSRILSQETLVTTAIILTALVFIGFTSSKVTQPTKYWALAAIIITVLAVLLAPSGNSIGPRP